MITYNLFHKSAPRQPSVVIDSLEYFEYKITYTLLRHATLRQLSALIATCEFHVALLTLSSSG